jgi:ATP-dependent exoDNAse (exonuclease V) beta subunit
LVEGAGRSERAGRDLDVLVAFADLVAQAEEGADPSTPAFLSDLEAGQEGPAWPRPGGPETDAVAVLTAHGSVGLEFHTVVIAGARESNFPSLSRPEPMFDLTVLERTVSQSERNRLRLADERRLFGMVVGRAAHRVLITTSDVHGDKGPSARSRFVDELGLSWTQAPEARDREPLSVAEAEALWRRVLAHPDEDPVHRLAALEGLTALGVDPARWWFQRDWTETGRPLHEEIRTSYSRLDTLENCELQFVLSE